MNRVLHIARREWLEQRRQPAMLFVMGLLFLLVAGLVVFNVALMQFVASDPLLTQTLVPQLAALGFEEQGALANVAELCVQIYSFLVFSQYLGIGAVLCGHAVLHDRHTGTLPFLLLAPVRRWELLVGKLIGALAPVTAIWFVINLSGSLMLQALPIASGASAYLPTTAAWWLGFVVGGPAWGAFIGAICVVVSTIARDVRTAQQTVWFVVFFATLVAGYLLSVRLPYGLFTQVEAVLLALVGLSLTITIGSMTIQRDLGR